MSAVTVTPVRLREGVWQALVVHDLAGTPPLEVTLHNNIVPNVKITEADSGPNHWLLQVPVPLEAISDGVTTFVVTHTPDGEVVAHFTLIAGETLEHDARAELDLLRAELDMLKRAFRRHCVETE